MKGFISISVILGIAVVALAAVFSLKMADSEKQITELKTHISQIEIKIADSEELFGSTRAVGSRVYRLAGSGVSSVATSLTLQSFTAPVSGHELLMADFGGTIGYLVIDPGSDTKRETVSFTAVSQSGSDTKATLSGVTRGLQFTYPYTASSTLGLSHSGGSIAIISDPPGWWNRAMFADNNASVTEKWFFSSTNTLEYMAEPVFTGAQEIVTKFYVDNVSIAGAANATVTVKGIVEFATVAQLFVGQATDTTGAWLAVAGSDVHSSASANIIPITGGDNYIDQGFLDLTESWTWTGVNAMASTTINNTLAVMGTSSFTGEVSIIGALTATTASTTLGDTTFNSSPFGPAATATDNLHLVSKIYVDEGFFPSISALATSTMATSSDTFVATTTTFVIVSCENGPIAGNVEIVVDGFNGEDNVVVARSTPPTGTFWTALSAIIQAGDTFTIEADQVGVVCLVYEVQF